MSVHHALVQNHHYYSKPVMGNMQPEDFPVQPMTETSYT
jgi:hypothetical protein